MDKNDERALTVLRKYLEELDDIHATNLKIQEYETAPIGAVSRERIMDLYGRRDAIWQQVEYRLRTLRAWRSGEDLVYWAMNNPNYDADTIPEP